MKTLLEKSLVASLFFFLASLVMMGNDARGADRNIYIDSVPPGAEVYLLPADEESSEKGVVLGKTPLVIEASKCPSMKFWVNMNMDVYLGQVEKIPEMKDWIKSFKSDRFFGGDGIMAKSDYFNFEVATSRSTSGTRGGGLISVGPVYNLGWPDHNRLCTLFVPKGKKISSFYSLMPADGTFTKPAGSWRDIMERRYRFSNEQIEEAMGSLPRCGKYLTMVKDPFKDGVGREYDITVQGGGKETIITTICEIRIIPGFNDR